MQLEQQESFTIHGPQLEILGEVETKLPAPAKKRPVAAGVLALCVGEVAAQVFVDLVCAGLDGVNEAAASHDGIQRLDGYIIVLQRFQHKLEAPGKLLGGVVEGLELVGRVLDGGGENGCLVFVNGNLCGS